MFYFHPYFTCFDFVNSGERSLGDPFGLSWTDPLLFGEASQLSNGLDLLSSWLANCVLGDPFWELFCEFVCEIVCELLCDLDPLQDFLTGLGFASPSAKPRACLNFRGGTGGGADGNSGGTLFFSGELFFSALTTSGLSAPLHLTISLITSCDSFNRLTQSNRVMCVTGTPSIESTWKRDTVTWPVCAHVRWCGKLVSCSCSFLETNRFSWESLRGNWVSKIINVVRDTEKWSVRSIHPLNVR